MPHFNLFDLVRWLHFICLVVGGGAAVVALLLSGLEDDREDLRGLAATLWKKVVAWSFRLAVLTGLLLVGVLSYHKGRPFDATYLWIKLPMVLLLLAVSETSTKALARARRGAPLLALLLFLLVSLLVFNKNAFGYRQHAAPAPAELSAASAAK